MLIKPNSMKPIYIQIAEGIEDDILNEIIQEDTQAYSQYQISKQYNINPATAAKGINLLVQEGILYKKRGFGMYVIKGAKDMIIKKRKGYFFESTINELLLEAEKLGISTDDIKQKIDSYRKENQQ